MSTITCPHCHQQHPDNAQFCPITGQAIPARRTSPLPYIIGIILALLIFGGFGWWYSSSQLPTTQVAQSPSLTFTSTLTRSAPTTTFTLTPTRSASTSTFTSTLTPLPPSITPTKTIAPTQIPTSTDILIYSTVPAGNYEIVGYGWGGGPRPYKCYALGQGPNYLNIQIDVRYCQCNEQSDLAAGKILESDFCKEIGFPNPPAPLILKTPYRP